MNFDLRFDFLVASRGLTGYFDYTIDLFEAPIIARMAAHFLTLLEGIVANPEGCLSELPLLTEAERQQLLIEWNETKIEYPRDACVHELYNVPRNLDQ